MTRVADRRVGLVLTMGLALAASLTGLGNGFALDDLPIIALDPRVHALATSWHFCCTSYWPRGYGGGLYRPATSVLFALEWAAGHGAPIVFHAVSIGLYAVVCAAVLALATELLGPTLGMLAAALFAVHPAHVEVVANVVGQAELVTALAVIAAVTLYLRARRVPTEPVRGRALAGIGALFALGLLAKEHGVVLPLLLLAAEVTVVQDDRPLRVRFGALWPLLATLMVVGLAYSIARVLAMGWAFGDTPNPALVPLSPVARGWTMLAVAGEWMRLLVWPVHLAALYGPPGLPVLAGPDWAAASGAAAVIIAITVAVVCRRSAPVVTFGIVWTGIVLLPVTNLFFVSGVFLAERSLFLPSVGAMCALAGLAGMVPWRRATLVAAGVVVVLGVWRSAIRQPVWHDNHTLLVQAVREAPRSYVAHYQLGGQLMAEGQTAIAEQEVANAIRLSNGYGPALAMLAEMRARGGDCASAIPLWRRALEQYPGMVQDRLGLANCLIETGDYAGARSVAQVGISQRAWVHTFTQVIARADSAAAAHG
jgi:protein O-mannosyl-transferase